MTFKALPALLDRLDHALNAQGVKLKRSQLLEAASYAFGYRCSNEMTKAAAKGDINPPPVNIIGSINLPDGQTIVVLEDPLANAPYAIDEAFLDQVGDERRESLGITPYGHLVRLEQVAEEVIPALPQASGLSGKTMIYSAIVSHRHGSENYTATTEDDLYRQLAEYARENWHEVEDYAEGDDPETMGDRDVVEAYFDLCANHEIGEYLDTSSEELSLQAGSATPCASTGMTSEGTPLATDYAEIAATLEEGATSDIWYDAHEFSDPEDEEDSDTQAESTIERSQKAMQDAAEILRALAAGQIAMPQIAASAARPENEGIQWLAGTDGHIDIDHLNDDEIAYLGTGEWLNMESEHPAQLGSAALWRGKKWVVPSIEFSWATGGERDEALARAEAYISAIRPIVDAYDGILTLNRDATDECHDVSIFLPLELAKESPSFEEWKKALAYILTLPELRSEQKQVQCRFIPEVDARKHIMQVDPLGEDEWDGTFDALRWGRDYAKSIFDGSGNSDDYAGSPLAPDWMKMWQSSLPYTVELDGLEGLYDLW